MGKGRGVVAWVLGVVQDLPEADVVVVGSVFVALGEGGVGVGGGGEGVSEEGDGAFLGFGGGGRGEGGVCVVVAVVDVVVIGVWSATFWTAELRGAEGALRGCGASVGVGGEFAEGGFDALGVGFAVDYGADGFFHLCCKLLRVLTHLLDLRCLDFIWGLTALGAS